MVQVSVTADSPKVAGETRDALMNDLQDELSRVQTQAGAPRESWIQAFPKPNEKILPVAGSKARTFVIVFGIGAALALMVAFVVDGFQKGCTQNSTRCHHCFGHHNSRTNAQSYG